MISSFAKRSPLWGAPSRRWLMALMAALGLLSLHACSKSELCGDAELCNYRDDDCDGEIDEDFRDDAGRYHLTEHCGGCEINCREQFPSASEVACIVDEEGARCAIVSCPSGSFLEDGERCVPELPVLCLPCAVDEDCSFRDPSARCADGRCLPSCEARGCPAGFSCDVESHECVFTDAHVDPCLCPDAVGELEIACLVDGPHGRCEGLRHCASGVLGECTVITEEICNGLDDNCDGQIDEGFRDELGRYVHEAHCGACDAPCVAPGPNMRSRCEIDVSGRPHCAFECDEGFVDVDGYLATGCECELWLGEGPPPSAGGDHDCDGIPDETDDFIYVSVNGSDHGAGTLEEPMRTLSAAILRAELTGKDVLVSQGDYRGLVMLRDGVSVYGGYQEGFGDRDLGLYPVRILAEGPSMPALRAQPITSSTTVEGLTIVGSEGLPGEGSTAVYLDSPSSGLVFRDVLILAAPGGDGARGASSVEHLGELGFSTLRDLDGEDGTPGAHAPNAACRTIGGGRGGQKSCGGIRVSGGDGADGNCPTLGCRYGDPCGNSGCTDYMIGGRCDYERMLSEAVPHPSAEDGEGPLGGKAGEVSYSSVTNWGVCNYCDNNPTLNREGQDGERGGDGSDGVAGLGCEEGIEFDPARGLLRGSRGLDGAPGMHGSGGGGGSSGGGYSVIAGTSGSCSDRPGGGGGGAGSGGCGAPRTTGGEGGGASVGVLVRLLPGAFGPRFENTRVVTASGGFGGDGGDGAAGGHAGTGAAGGGAEFWCTHRGGRGGDGGRGGAAGGGGGGCGGGSHAVVLLSEDVPEAYVNDLELGLVVDRAGVGGRGGRGGRSPGQEGSAGSRGSDAAIQILSGL